jgi:hypothetical protein
MTAHNLKVVKKEMASYREMKKIKYSDYRNMAPYILEKSLAESRLQFLWLTDMQNTRATMPNKYGKVKYCPHCDVGKVLGVPETPEHLMQCEAYIDLRARNNPELVRRTESDTYGKL